MSVESCFVIHVYEIDYRLGEKVTWISFPPMPAVCNKIEKTANPTTTMRCNVLAVNGMNILSGQYQSIRLQNRYPWQQQSSNLMYVTSEDSTALIEAFSTIINFFKMRFQTCSFHLLNSFDAKEIRHLQ